MDDRTCGKCGSTNYYMTVDKRGVPEIRCSECDSFIVKSNTLTLNAYYLERLDKAYKEFEAQENNKPDKPLCRYCTERWAILDGRMGVRAREMNDIKFCPMCGRELKATDKQY